MKSMTKFQNHIHILSNLLGHVCFLKPITFNIHFHYLCGLLASFAKDAVLYECLKFEILEIKSEEMYVMHLYSLYPIFYRYVTLKDEG